LPAEEVLTLSGGGSENTSCVGLSKEIGIPIKICHYPHGRKQVEQNRTQFVFVHQYELEGAPLPDYQIIVDLLRNAKTRTGFSVKCLLDTNKCLR
jgi:hypothetical protein